MPFVAYHDVFDRLIKSPRPAGRRVQMAPLAVSVVVHLTLAAALLIVVPTGVARVTARAPVRITYFEQPRQAMEPSQLELTLPEVEADPSQLSGRPMTAPVGGIAAPGSVGLPGGGAVPGGAGDSGEAAPEATDIPLSTEAPTPPSAAVAEARAESTPRRGSVAVVAPVQQVASASEPKATPPPAPPPAAVTPAPRAAPEAVASVDQSMAPGEILTIAPGMARPQITRRVVPKYPPIARSQRVTGIVQVEVVINEKGQVIDAKVVASPSPLLNSEALKAAEDLRFKPYEYRGQIVSVRTRIPFKFDFRR